MALIKCPECGTEISDKAPACIKCGAPIAAASHDRHVEFHPPKVHAPGWMKLFFGVVLLGILAVFYMNAASNKPSSEPAAESPVAVAPPAEKPAKVECNADDLQCLGDKGVIGAGVYCPREVEKLATHSVKWTDGVFEMKFSSFRWRNQTKGEITYVGDRAEFQNGFGAFTPVIYECDMAADNETILDVRVSEGRLP